MVVANNVLQSVKENMDVYDHEGKNIGTVEYVFFGDAGSPVQSQSTEAAVSDHYLGEVASFARALTNNGVLIELRDRMIRDGFVKLDTGLLRSDRYILPNQISDVTPANVWLKVSRDDLLKS